MGSVIRIGCSGWDYLHWRGSFYDASTPREDWLTAYARVFSTVEVNNTFYRLPEAETFSAWRSRVPASFVVAVKASRYLTHVKRLREPIEPLERLFERARYLGSALGPVLYQLPPRWTPNLERLGVFLKVLPRHVRPRGVKRPQRLQHAVEFRDPRWYDDAVCCALADHGVALCVHDMPGSVSPRTAVGPFAYLRLHGDQKRYSGRYRDATLHEWAEWLMNRAQEGQDAYVYLNNDAHGHAPRDALRLRAMLEEEGVDVR